MHDPPPHFQGLNPNAPIHIYTRNLPHWRQDGATYFVTFRLADSLPQECIEELRAIKSKWTKTIERKERDLTLSDEEKKCEWEKLARIMFEKTEIRLDQEHGSCVLRERGLREILTNSFDFFDDQRYALGCYVIMPNHVHLVIRPLKGYALEEILQSQKRHASRKINEINGNKGALWQEESHDRIIRDAEHLWRCVQYIGRNPAKANLRESEFTRYIRPEWQRLGWDFLDENP